MVLNTNIEQILFVTSLFVARTHVIKGKICLHLIMFIVTQSEWMMNLDAAKV